MSIAVACHACGRLHTFPDIVPFRADCEGCAADLHACLGCRFYDRYVDNECREDAADPVSTKDRRNLCEYWKPKLQEDAVDDAASIAKAKLAALFGGASAPASPVPSSPAGPLSAADEAKRKLEALFKK